MASSYSELRMSRINWERLDEIADRLVDRLARDGCKRLAQGNDWQGRRGGASTPLPEKAAMGTLAANDNFCGAGRPARELPLSRSAHDLSSHGFR